MHRYIFNYRRTFKQLVDDRDSPRIGTKYNLFFTLNILSISQQNVLAYTKCNLI